MSELKPCPFCGGTVYHIEPEYAHIEDYIRCDECDFDMPNGQQFPCIHKWNTRTPQWMPIESLMESDGIVLLWSDWFDYPQAGYVGQFGIKYVGVDSSDASPTHWMPLPLPPKEIP